LYRWDTYRIEIQKDIYTILKILLSKDTKYIFVSLSICIIAKEIQRSLPKRSKRIPLSNKTTRLRNHRKPSKNVYMWNNSEKERKIKCYWQWQVERNQHQPGQQVDNRVKEASGEMKCHYRTKKQSTLRLW
jgi:hypothetical protein